MNEDADKDMDEDVDKDVNEDVDKDVDKDVDGTRVSRDWVRTGERNGHTLRPSLHTILCAALSTSYAGSRSMTDFLQAAPQHLIHFVDKIIPKEEGFFFKTRD